MSQFVSTALSRIVIDGALPLVDSRIKASTTPYSGKPAMTPNLGSRWSMIHYGIFLPKLPDPYRYLNTMTLIGATGTEIFDNDQLVAPDARQTTTVLSSTAHSSPEHEDQYIYRAYSTDDDCDFADDGSLLRWGNDLTIAVDGNTARITGRYPHFAVDLTVNLTDQVSYFVRTPIYDHFSRLAPYEGMISDASGSTQIEGLGTFEYARAMTHQRLFRSPIADRWKLPADFFTYQIIEIDERTQVLLTCVSARGRTACLLMHLRILGEETAVFADTTFKVTEFGEDLVDEWGRRMRVPARFRWTARNGAGQVLTLDGEPDSAWRFGHGRGYVGAYTYSGTLRGEAVHGTGYIEWVDTQAEPRTLWG
ncbi:MAG: DUF6670 family protein [Gordonia sp. (in: high G+C Gram-positive bacteria)]